MDSAPSWSRLDNVGKLFPSVLSDRLTNLFRLSVTLKQEVSRDSLQTALETILPRFPYYQVKVRPGWFWYSLLYDRKTSLVIDDGAYPCMPLKKEVKEPHLFRVRVQGKVIALEFNHVLTDGTGALLFLKVLLGEYLKLQHPPGILDSGFTANQIPDPLEWEDGFAYHKHKGLPSPPALPKAFRLPWKLAAKGIYYVTTGEISFKALNQKAKAAGCGITAFLAGHLLYSFQTLQQEILGKSGQLKPVTILCPVNLRKYFPSKTMRNFFLTVPLTVDFRLGTYSLEELLQIAQHELSLETDFRKLQQRIAHNRRGELLPFMRIIPLFLKNIIINTLFSLGNLETSTSLSNLGAVNLPDPWNTWVESFQFIPPPNPITKNSVSVISYGDLLAVSFGRMTEIGELERLFFTGLIKSGLAVKVVSNFGE